MNGNGNKHQRLGEHFLKELEEMISEIEDKQNVKLSISKLTNFITTHADWESIKKDTVTFNFNEYMKRWRI